MSVKFIQVIYNYLVFKIGSLRALFWSLFVKKMGKGVCIMESCKIFSPSGVEIGDKVYINHHTGISGNGGVKIGNYVLIGSNCSILTILHKTTDWRKPILEQGMECAPIEIEDDVWIGVNAVILPGVKIGKGAIIGANAVVTKDVAPFSLVGGVPAEFIKYRFNQDDIKKANKINFSNP